MVKHIADYFPSAPFFFSFLVDIELFFEMVINNVEKKRHLLPLNAFTLGMVVGAKTFVGVVMI
jgi:hypothetical protein